MAASFKITRGVSWTDANGKPVPGANIPSWTDTATPSGTRPLSLPKTITSASEVTIDLTTLGISSVRAVLVKNLDATNYITCGAVTGSSNHSIKVMAGRTEGPFKLNGTSLFAQANTADCSCQIIVYPE